LGDYIARYYEEGDLFDAVVASEKLSSLNSYDDSKSFVSDVVFIQQDVTSVWVRNSSGDVSRTLKIDSRLGLESGQMVRMYYTVSYYRAWVIVAVELL
jgi:hypothetical protein